MNCKNVCLVNKQKFLLKYLVIDFFFQFSIIYNNWYFILYTKYRGKLLLVKASKEKDLLLWQQEEALVLRNAAV